jgi:hypothetical protein
VNIEGQLFEHLTDLLLARFQVLSQARLNEHRLALGVADHSMALPAVEEKLDGIGVELLALLGQPFSSPSVEACH